jgi:hypothetical protein
VFPCIQLLSSETLLESSRLLQAIRYIVSNDCFSTVRDEQTRKQKEAEEQYQKQKKEEKEAEKAAAEAAVVQSDV